MRALIGKPWDPEKWNRDVWEDSEEAGDIESEHSEGFVLPEDEDSPPSTELPSPLGEMLQHCLGRQSKVMLIPFRTHLPHPFSPLGL